MEFSRMAILLPTATSRLKSSREVRVKFAGNDRVGHTGDTKVKMRLTGASCSFGTTTACDPASSKVHHED